MKTFPGFLLPVLLVMNGDDCQALARIQPEELSEVEHRPDLGNLSVCTALSCGGRRNTPLYNKIKSEYSDLFMSEDAIQRLDCRLAPGRSVSQCQRPNSDRDRCCPTVSEFIPVSGTMIDAIYNEPCHILSFNNLHQLIHVGRCDPTHPGGCERKGQGRCIQEKKYVTLLCLTNWYRLVFRLFEVDGYCSCRYRYQWQTEAVQFSQSLVEPGEK